MSTKSKAKAIVAPVFSSAAFFDAGFACGQDDGRAELIIAACAEGNVAEALRSYTEGYVYGRLIAVAPKDAEGNVPKAEQARLRKHATAIMDGLNSNAKSEPKPGQHKCTDAEWNYRIVGARRFNRVREKLNVKPANNSGGHGNNAKAEPKAETPKAETPKAEPAPKVINAGDLRKAVHTFKGQWAALMTAGQKVELPSETRDIAAQITRLINAYEMALTEAVNK